MWVPISARGLEWVALRAGGGMLKVRVCDLNEFTLFERWASVARLL
jgi:hypothetical protein